MANKHEAREPGTKPAVWVRSEPGTAWFYAGPSRPGYMRAGLRQKNEPVGLDSPARFSNRARRAGPDGPLDHL